MLRFLLFGKNGQLGWELQETISPLGQLTSLDIGDLDLENFDEVRTTINKVRPHIIINASAYTAVDKAESEPDKAYRINADIPRIISEEALALKAAFIHYSTDYVFDGIKGTPYTEFDVTNPINIYGKSKLAGEQNIRQLDGANLIFRTSWVYSLRQRSGFARKVLDWSRKQKTLRIVDDHIGSPTWARMLAETTALVISQGHDDPIGFIEENAGLYHVAGNGSVSRINWARRILELDQLRHQQIMEVILPAASFDFPTAAERPRNTSLDCTKFIKTFEISIPPWEDSLILAMNNSENIPTYERGSNGS
jgi:dTDP-4-dehydrorhamnose reductase